MNELDALIFAAEKRGATDIIIDAESAFLRVDRKLKPFSDVLIPSPYEILEQIFTNFPESVRARYLKNIEDTIEVDCAFNSGNVRIRANIFTSLKGLKFALRIIPQTRLTAEQIGIPITAISDVQQQSGLFLVTGISGSGKTTTLAAILDVINNTSQKHILTIEDPIEYVFENRKSIFSQREIPTHTKDFANALRSSVRENADIILIGEMRDYNTVKAAIELAETGHLVLSTLHTRNAISTIDRILSMANKEEAHHIRTMISIQLIGVLSQTLLHKSSTKGGLIASFEYMHVTNAIRNLIRDDKIPMIYSELQTGFKDGAVTMEEYLATLVERSIISLPDALRSTSRIDVLKQRLQNSPAVNQFELQQFLD